MKLKLFCFTMGVLMSLNSICQNKITGSVIDKETQEPIAQVQIFIPGTSTGTTTNQKGKFSLTLPENKTCTIQISYLGYEEVVKEINPEKISSPLLIELKSTSLLIDQVVVTGTGTPNRIKDSPVLTELITKKDIESVSSGNIEELMSTISPSFDFSPNLMGSFMTLNGLGNDYILILVDGKRLYGDIGGQTDLSRISPNNIEKIEVVKGASSSLYGSEAIAGVINIITKKSKKGIYLENDTRIGDYGKWQQFNTISLNSEKFQSTTSFSRKQSKGWKLSPYEVDKKRTKDPSDDELVMVYDKASNEFFDNQFRQELNYSLNPNINMYAHASYYKKSTLIPTEVKAYGYDYQDISYSLGAKYNFKNRNQIQFDYHTDNFKYYYLYTRKYDVKVTDETGDKILTYRDGDRPIQTNQLRNTAQLKSILQLGEKNRLNLGTEYVFETLEAPYRLIGDKLNVYTYSIYAQDEIQLFSSLFFTVGFRYVLHENFGSKITPKLSAMYKLGKFNLRSTYSSGFKAPTLKELYYEYEKSGMGSHYLYLGAPSLKPQNSDYFSASLSFNSVKLSTSLHAYYNQIKNLIDYKRIETNPEDAARGVRITKINSNIKEAQTKGIDYKFQIKMSHGFSAGIGYSYVDAENITDSIPLEGVSEHYGTFNSSWKKRIKKYRLGISILGRAQTERYYDDGNAPAYSIWKLSTTHHYPLTESVKLTLTLGLNNIFDEVDDRPYGSHYSTLSPGRTFFAGLNFNFGN